MVGMLVMAALAWVGILTGWAYSLEPLGLCWAASLLIVLGVTSAGAFSLRFELEGTANQTLEATADPPSS